MIRGKTLNRGKKRPLRRSFLLFNSPDNFCRVSDCKRIVRNIFCYNCPCSNNTPISDCYSRKNYDTSSKPAIFSYFNGLCAFYKSVSGFVIQGVNRSIKLGVRPYKGVTADCYRRTVKNNTVGIKINSVS